MARVETIERVNIDGKHMEIWFTGRDDPKRSWDFYLKNGVLGDAVTKADLWDRVNNYGKAGLRIVIHGESSDGRGLNPDGTIRILGADLMIPVEVKPRVARHFKGGIYEILDDNAVFYGEKWCGPIVIYRSTDDGAVYARSYENFFGAVSASGEPRFTEIET